MDESLAKLKVAFFRLEEPEAVRTGGDSRRAGTASTCGCAASRTGGSVSGDEGGSEAPQGRRAESRRETSARCEGPHVLALGSERTGDGDAPAVRRDREVLCLAIRARTVSTVPLGRLGVDLDRLAIASGVSPLPAFASDEDELFIALVPNPDEDELPVDSSASLDAAKSEPFVPPATAAAATILAITRARPPPLGERYLIADQGVDERPVVGLELSLVGSLEDLAESVQRVLELLPRRALLQPGQRGKLQLSDPIVTRSHGHAMLIADLRPDGK